MKDEERVCGEIGRARVGARERARARARAQESKTVRERECVRERQIDRGDAEKERETHRDTVACARERGQQRVSESARG